ncbi:unnamed protein product [Peronospora belbahrii]|uniref:HTH CENPB-type domain-containing protein n=1 Tax=Peronospora belbahrii TaxID=622444 RepID=A0AAU9KP86_9STRA|nr:unnamed protein product [Peronospora belbahrii]CAH0473441.1 unnamed protein product [Peronospora belbahrii]
MGRQPLKEGGGRKERKNIRTSASFEMRLAAIKQFEESGDMATTVESIFPTLTVQAKRSKKRVIYGWVKNRDKIEKACESVNTAKAHRLLWLRSLQRLGVPVTGAMLSEHALEVAKELGIDNAHFAASAPWRKKFLQRHNLTM